MQTPDENPSLHLLYLMEDTDLSGGVRIQLAQADALIRRGHRVTIATKGPPLRWRRSAADWLYVDDFSTLDVADMDFVIATFWTTVEPAFALAPDRTIHLCQGYEGSFTAYQELRPRIDHAYGLPIPKMVVSPSLIPEIAHFGSDVVNVGQIVDDEFFRTPPEAESAPPRVLLVGASQIDFKGIDLGYGAIVHARWHGHDFELVRVSPWAPAGDEPVSEHVAEFHAGLDALAMCRLMHSCDLFLGPSRRQEGFGLPAAEALASGLPAVLTRIPSFLSFGEPQDYAWFADEEDAISLGERLGELLDDPSLRKRLRHRGREVVETFRAQHVAGRIEEFLLERRRRRG